MPQIQASSYLGMALNSHTNVCSDSVKAMAFDKATVMPYSVFRFSIVAPVLSLLYSVSASVVLAPLKASAGLKNQSRKIPMSVSTYCVAQVAGKLCAKSGVARKAFTKSRQSEALSASENIEILSSCHFH